MTAVVEIVSPDGVATVEIGIVGPQGPPGLSGAAAASYVHNQAVPSASWTITHNLGFFPNVTVQDSTGRTVEGDITYTNSNSLVLTFSGAFSGVAYLS
jgi:hypothetical protein